MASGVTAWLDRALQRRLLARWTRLADAAGSMDIAEMRRQRGRAAALKRQVDRVILEADRRLATPATGEGPARPLGADWVWRPGPWAAPLPRSGIAAVPQKAELCRGVTLYHDAAQAEVTLRQLRATSLGDPAPFALAIDALAFEGSFLSLAIELPETALAGLRNRHVISATLKVAMERRLEAYARLNIRHGPNQEQVVRAFDPGTAEVEFDLAHTRMNERRVEALWLDLIFDSPAMNRIAIGDVTVSRRPRAGL
jgi:Family of unknown function (DUF6478)